MVVIMAAVVVVHVVTMSLASAMNIHIHPRISGDAISVSATCIKELQGLIYELIERKDQDAYHIIQKNEADISHHFCHGSNDG